MAKILFTAIVFFPEQKNLKPRKYRNVQEISFTMFAKKQGAAYFNLYKQDKSFYKQIKIS
jgi:hypothetical protein